MFPNLSVPTTTTFIPAITADAGLVPWADDGIIQIFLFVWFKLLKYERITMRPAYSPWAPELGCKEVPLNPVISFNWFFNFSNIKVYPSTWSEGAKGWILFHLDELNGNISAAAFSFIVHEPRAIIEWLRERSFLSRLLMYLIIDVSDW